ncbi:tetratricopeptide repeat-containing glycosyltransferase family 2 protein [Clostridium prolinivorans]|uniref:tetratricopeptide repeat-containing glycosyltransferase family 2 protein n=1 Tax=Clostridium prolinivorans TaxID=2769420 RepID=UPI000FD71748|nr:TPR domain-containing glycosyltransferase [Clostridium prolinivorans]
MKNSISLCMIVKDEEEYLPRCLKSIKDIVDEIIIVDTGSKDKTVEIAKSFGANVYYFKWTNNFSEARNESLKYATKDWILILDADDEVYSEDQKNLKSLLDSSLDENIIYYFQTINYCGDVIDDNFTTMNLNPRLFKNNKGIHYEGEVHNQLSYPENIQHAICDFIKIHHYGYMNKVIKNKDKKNRTITLLKNQLEKNPDEPFANFNLGTEYAGLNDYKNALKHFYKSYEKFDPQNGYSFLLILRIVIANYQLKDFDNALKFVNIGIEYYPDFTDLYFFKSLIFKDLDMPILQIKALKKCVELGEAPPQLRCYYGTGSFKAYYELGNAYFNLKDYDTAYNYYIETMKSKNDFITPLYNIAHILKIRNTPLEDFKKIMEDFLPDSLNSKLILINLFFNEDYYDTALEYIEKYEQYSTITENLNFIKAKCLLMTGKFNECICLNNVEENNSYYVPLSMYKVISNILINNYNGALSILNNFKEDNLSNHDKKHFKVYSQLLKLFTREPLLDISNEENESEYLNIILEILEILLVNNKFNEFKIAVNLLNLINNKFILLALGKLYYKYGYIEHSKNELIRSIKEFEVYDKESLKILMN